MEKTAYVIGFELALLNAGFTKEAMAAKPGLFARLMKFMKMKNLDATSTATYQKSMGRIVGEQGGAAGAKAVDSTAEKMLAQLRKPKAPRTGRKFDPSKHVTPAGK